MDIYDLLFYQILKFDPMNNILSGEFGHDMIYGLLIPAILLYLILVEFSSFFAGRHRGIKHLVTIAALAVIIESGWYATIAGFSGVFFPLALILFILVFVKRKIITRKQEGAGSGLIGKVLGYTGVKGRVEQAMGNLRPNRSNMEVENAVRRIVGLQNTYHTEITNPAIFQGRNTAGMNAACDDAIEILNGFNPRQQKEIMKKAVNSVKGNKKYTVVVGKDKIETDFDENFYVSIAAGLIQDTT